MSCSFTYQGAKFWNEWSPNFKYVPLTEDFKSDMASFNGSTSAFSCHSLCVLMHNYVIICDPLAPTLYSYLHQHSAIINHACIIVGQQCFTLMLSLICFYRREIFLDFFFYIRLFFCKISKAAVRELRGSRKNYDSPLWPLVRRGILASPKVRKTRLFPKKKKILFSCLSSRDVSMHEANESTFSMLQVTVHSRLDWHQSCVSVS